MVVGFLSIMIDLVDHLQVISEISDPPSHAFPPQDFPETATMPWCFIDGVLLSEGKRRAG
jgi:hypothetical protein